MLKRFVASCIHPYATTVSMFAWHLPNLPYLMFNCLLHPVVPEAFNFTEMISWVRTLSSLGNHHKRFTNLEATNYLYLLGNPGLGWKGMRHLWKNLEPETIRI